MKIDPKKVIKTKPRMVKEGYNPLEVFKWVILFFAYAHIIRAVINL